MNAGRVVLPADAFLAAAERRIAQLTESWPKDDPLARYLPRDFREKLMATIQDEFAHGKGVMEETIHAASEERFPRRLGVNCSAKYEFPVPDQAANNRTTLTLSSPTGDFSFYVPGDNNLSNIYTGIDLNMETVNGTAQTSFLYPYPHSLPAFNTTDGCCSFVIPKPGSIEHKTAIYHEVSSIDGSHGVIVNGTNLALPTQDVGAQAFLERTANAFRLPEKH